MKTLCEDLNPKCKKISDKANDLMFQATGSAEDLCHRLHLLEDRLEKECVLGYEGYMKLHVMAARASNISDELVELINLIDEKDMCP